VNQDGLCFVKKINAATYAGRKGLGVLRVAKNDDAGTTLLFFGNFGFCSVLNTLTLRSDVICSIFFFSSVLNSIVCAGRVCAAVEESSAEDALCQGPGVPRVGDV